jgi:hypothetical protein
MQGHRSRLGPKRPRFSPEVEGLEVRELLSGASTGTKVVHIVPTAAPSFDPPASPVKDLYHQPLVPNLNLLPTFVNLTYPSTPGQPPTPQPTSQEVHREYFLAKFSGTYDVHPGRFSYQALTIHVASKDGGSNQFLHGRMQFVIFPTKAGDPEPLSGQVSFIPQNYLQESDLLVFNLSPAPAGEPTGQATENGTPLQVGNGISLPTHLHWSYDLASAGGYTAPQGFTQGDGYMDVEWIPDKTTKPGTLASGRVVVLFQGLLNTSSVVSALDPGVTA